MKRSVYIVGLMVLATACVKRPVPETTGTIVVPEGNHEHEHGGDVNFVISHTAGSQLLELDTKWYLTDNNDSVKFSVFNYYLSNFVFVDENGKEYKQPESYYLVKESNQGSKSFTAKGIPAGRYKQLRMLIGVDSARNVSGAQTGALDPANNMFWDWNTGYIMLMIEGSSPRSEMPNNMIAFHFGGFKKKNSAIREVTLNFPGTLVVTEEGSSMVKIKTDIMECFKTPNAIDIQVLTAFLNTGGGLNAKMADNYGDMMIVTDVE